MAKKRDLLSDDDSPDEPNPLGRPPKLPKGLEGYLTDLCNYCKDWRNRYEKVWFAGAGLIETARGAAAHPESPGWYEYAINRLLEIIDFATEGKEKLEKAKAAAERMLAEKKDDSQPTNEEPQAEPDRSYEDYFGPENGHTEQ